MTNATAAINAELVVIKAQMRAVETTLPAGECPIAATDPMYARQEALHALLWDLEDADEATPPSTP
jgi:hypothetical protein